MSFRRRLHFRSFSVISFGSVIAQLDWAIQKKELDYPVKRLCHNENFYIDAGYVVAQTLVCAEYTQAKACDYHCDTASKPDNDDHWNRVRYE